MRTYEGVYADVSYHTDPMDGGQAELNYFNNLKELINDDTIGKRVLWGTDYTLVRQRAREENYWAYFQRHLTSQEFEQIAEINPQAYLGLPEDDGSGAKQNIQRYAHFLHKHEWTCRTDSARVGPTYTEK